MYSDTLKRQIHPLQVNEATGEPYLRLPQPYEHIIVTPPRATDSLACLPFMNDPSIYKWQTGVAFPHLEVHSSAWLKSIAVHTDRAWTELVEASMDPNAPLIVTSECPVRIIRELTPGGGDVYLGDCGFHRMYRFDEEQDQEQRDHLIAENIARPPGDAATIWSIGGVFALRST